MGKLKKSARSFLARNIIARREAHSWNQSELAHRVGVHKNIITKIETDKGEGEPATRQAIAQALGCELADLYRSPNAPNASALAFLTRLGNLSPLRQKMILSLVFDDASHMRGASQGSIQVVESLLKGQS